MQTRLFLAFLDPELSKEVERLSRECSVYPSELCRFALEGMLPKILSGEVKVVAGKLHTATTNPSLEPHHELSKS